MSNINNNNNNNNNSMHQRSSSSSSSNSMIINSSSLFSNAMMLGPSSSFFTSNNNNSNNNNNNNMSHNNTSNHFYNNNNNFYNSSNNNGQFSSYNNINNINNNNMNGNNNNNNNNNNSSGDLVCWNPHTSTRFNVISNRDIHYYRINEEVFNRVVENGFDDSVEIMHRKQEDLFHLISTTNLPYPAKCHSWSPDHRDIIALGLQNGTVVLNNIRLNKIVTEFVPKSVRPCKSLSWNPTQTNLIAAGFDKMRSDGGVVVWDVNMLDLEMMRVMMDDGTSSVSSVTSGGAIGGMNGGGGGGLMNFYRSSSSTSLSSFDVANSNNMSNNNNSSGGGSSNYVNHSMGRSRSLSVLERIDKPAYEVGLSDAAHAVCWIPGQRISLLMAANPRYLRVYDLREYTNLKATRPSVNFAAHNKSIQGISFNPVDQHQFASFSEDGQVKVWDMRKLPNPLRELPISSKRDPSIAQIEWSSTNRNVLGVLMRDGQSIRLWNMNPPGTDRSVRAALSPYKSLYTRDEPIASFSFHPNIARCMLVSTQSGQIKYVFTKDYPKFSISPRGTIVSLHQKLMIERMLTQTSPTSSLSTPNNNNNEMVDYCCLMKMRADKSIGMNQTKNLEIAKEMKEQDMIELWSWINRVKQLNESGDRKLHPSQHNYTGVKSLLTASLDSPIMFKLPPTSPFTSSKFSDYPKNLQSTTTTVLQQSPPTTPLSSTSFSGGQAVQEVFETQARISRLFPSLKVYSSPQRSLIVEMCGWGQSLLNNINTCLESAMKRSNSAAALNNMSHMSNQGFMSSSSSMMSIVDEEAEDVATKLLKSQYLNERSVAIAIFAMDLNLAARLLIAIEDEQRRVGHNSGNNYKFLAYALGGFSGDRQREFKEVYSSLYPMHPNPYLRAALGFLSEISSTYDYSTVLNEAQISLCDRLAFASIYLPPDHLSIYVNRMSEESIQKGHLPGIILTGLNRDAVDLVQNYVDRTGDIQIACLLLKTVVPAQFEDKRVDVWLYNYRELLDQWQMWETRAYLDTKLNQYTSEKVSTRSTPEVSVKCTFCNQALVHKVLSSNRRNQLNNFTNKMGSGSYATRAKSTSCPSCRKPLPKCSICLMPFGSPHHSLGGNQQSSSQQHPSTHMGHHHGSEESATTTPGHQYGQLDYCFSWCTKCKHGGHVKHLMEWFSTHSVCAVSGCDCACFSPLASNGPTPAPSTTNATIPQ